MPARPGAEALTCACARFRALGAVFLHMHPGLVLCHAWGALHTASVRAVLAPPSRLSAPRAGGKQPHAPPHHFSPHTKNSAGHDQRAHCLCTQQQAPSTPAPSNHPASSSAAGVPRPATHHIMPRAATPPPPLMCWPARCARGCSQLLPASAGLHPPLTACALSGRLAAGGQSAQGLCGRADWSQGQHCGRHAQVGPPARLAGGRQAGRRHARSAQDPCWSQGQQLWPSGVSEAARLAGRPEAAGAAHTAWREWPRAAARPMPAPLLALCPAAAPAPPLARPLHAGTRAPASTLSRTRRRRSSWWRWRAMSGR